MRLAMFLASVVLSVAALRANAETSAITESDEVSSSASDPSVSALTDAAPMRGAAASPSNRILTIAAWPGYGMLAEEPSASGQSLRIALAAERAGFFVDLVSTYRGLTARNDFAERNSINTLFGNRNVVGVLGSMTLWEIGSSYASAKVPNLLQKTRFRGAARSSAFILDMVFAGERIRASACNLRLVGQQSISPTASCQP